MSENKQEAIQQYLDNNKKLIPLTGKKPIKGLEGWTDDSVRVSDDDIKAHADNIGWVMGNNDLVIDVDLHKEGDTLDGFSQLQKDIGCELAPTVATAGGGYHIYMKIPDGYDGMKFRRSLNKEYPGVEFITKGGKCTIAGSENYEWCDDLVGGFIQTLATPALMDLIAYQPKKAKDEHLGDLGEVIQDNVNITEPEIVAMLAVLDPSMGYQEWVRIGMALHSWTENKALSYGMNGRHKAKTIKE